MGTVIQFGRGHGEDRRFYDAAKARRSHHNYHSLQRSRSSVPAPTPARPPVSKPTKVFVAEDGREPENRAGFAEPSNPTAVPLTALSRNLDRFLESTTPSVRAQYISKTRMRGWRTCDVDVEYMPYFNLGDLWEYFKEWSAYGAGVPLVLNGRDCVVQYYVPYLSAIQLYGESTRLAANSSPLGEESDVDCSRDSSSDGSSDCELESRMDRLSLREKHLTLQEGFLSDEGEAGNSQDCLLFEYFEQNSPYSREPLADKVIDLARSFPELRTFRSCDMSSASWISVAWYPIYRIPTGPTMKDLDACFLTFHSLSTPITGAATASGPTITYPQGVDGIPMISLRVFGLASYKFKGTVWTPSGGCERQFVNSLLQDAENWLQQRNVSHPDYQFFASHGAYCR